MKERKPQYLTTDELVPGIDLASCYEFPTDRWFVYRIPSHHLILVETGRIEAKTPNGHLEAKAGDLVCFRSAEHNEYGTRGPTLFFQAHVQFAPPPRHRLTPWLNRIGPIPERVALGNSFDSMRRLFETLCMELGREGEAHQLRCRAAVLEMVALITDVCAGQASVPSSLDEWQRARLRLGSELQADLKIEEFARRMGVSSDHFIRHFKQRFGMTPKAYHNQVRFAEAARLLRSTDQPTKAIAFSVGFTDPKSFARAFRRHFGVAPSDLRLDPSTVSLRGTPQKAGMFPINQHVLPPHAGPGFLTRWVASKNHR